VKRDSSPPGLGEQFDEREAVGVELIRSAVDTFRAAVNRGFRLRSSGVGTNSLDEFGEPTVGTVLSRALPDRRTRSSPALGSNDGRKTSLLETVRSRLDAASTGVGRLTETASGRETGSLEELGGPTSATIASRILPTGGPTRSSPALGASGGRETSHLEAIRSRLDAVGTDIGRVLGSESGRRGAGSLGEAGGSAAPVSDRLRHVGNENVSRRAVVRTAGYAATAGAFGAALQGTEVLSQRTDPEEEAAVSQPETTVSHDVDHDQETAVHHGVERERHTILEGTQYETTIHTIASHNDGPTAMIFGGVHGNERGGIEAAHLATEYTIDRGTLVVSPETNKAAVEMDGNHGPEGDLNRQFPVGAEPTTEVARGVWDEIVRADPDYLIDAHNATTLMSRGSVGQGVFPTSGVVEEAEAAVAAVNEEYLEERVNDDLPEHAFQVGNVVTEDRPRMNNKAAADQGVEGWSTEVTRIDLTLDERTFLQDALTRELLDQIGIDVVSDPAMTNPL
jgi:uncharacterized protein